MMGDGYVAVTAKLVKLTTKAVLLQALDEEGDTQPRGAWIPCSCLHGADDRQLDRIALGETTTLHIREWIAEREGFV